MGFLDWSRSLLQSPATRRLEREARSSGLVLRSEAPAQPFDGRGYPVDGPPRIPPPSVNADQPPPAAIVPKYDPQYHGRTFRAYNIMRSLGGWDVGRMRAAIESHDLGIFLESYTLALACSRFGPIHAALKQRVAPFLGVERHVLGGRRGLSRIVREEVEADLAPRGGESASVTFPPSLWGAIAYDRALMNMAFIQHVYGEPDALGVRPVYSRRWPIWAVQCMVYRKTYQALTLDGPVDIVDGDGKWSIVATDDLPHLNAAIRPLGNEYLAGSFADGSEQNYIDRYGDPKPVGTLPEGVAPGTPEGDAALDMLDTFRDPSSWGALPHGMTLEMLEMSGKTSGVFMQSLARRWQYIAAILLGSDGTMTRGTGVYSAPIFAGVRLDLIRDDLKATTRAINFGRTRPWAAVTYGPDLKRVPVLVMPLPDPDQDARIESKGKRYKMLVEQLKAEAEVGAPPDQDRANFLAAEYGVTAPTIVESGAPPISITDTDRAKAYRVREVRAGDGYGPLGDSRDDLTIAELEAISKQRASSNQADAAAERGEGPGGEEGGPAKATPPTQGAAALASDASGSAPSDTKETTRDAPRPEKGSGEA